MASSITKNTRGIGHLSFPFQGFSPSPDRQNGEVSGSLHDLVGNASQDELLDPGNPAPSKHKQLIPGLRFAQDVPGHTTILKSNMAERINSWSKCK
jgi:hypothetical protein